MNNNIINKSIFKNYIFYGVALLFIASGALIYGINDRISFFEKSSNYISLEANVFDYDYAEDNKAAEVIEYTVNKNVYVKTLDVYTNNPRDIGSKIEIKYNPANPDDIIYNDNYSSYFILLFGFITLSISIIVVVRNYLVLKRFD